MKVCRECNVEQPLSEFYKHAAMGDGHLNKCKSCVKQRVNKHREENIEKAREYDRKRAMFPHRVQARMKYIQTEQGKQSRKKSMEKYYVTYPMKHAAHVITGNAVRDKKIEKQTKCSECKSTKKIEAHHDDYTKPLEVRWLCNACHRAWHKVNEPIYQ
jgi:hypothetical protein